ncbi:tyrosine-protein phosphatase [Nakamurella lactea]|uniref:tyrosine-protein phosphatase n=1 Tax=Nakamurella lactea TaxID=459515 RepID=UPI000409A4AD|nr:tyrosine-protein phosphatase [Nakamurella lactea]
MGRAWIAPDWDGAVNLHHLGGDVYRMARREWLTDAGWRQAHLDGVRTVIDLRSDRERRRRDTDPQVDPAVLQQIRLVPAATEDPDHPEYQRILVPYLDHPQGYADYLRLFPDRVAAAFRAVAAAEGAVVIHCSAGRDRTGLIAAMLQELAGVPRGQILDGYEAAARGINDHLRGRSHQHERWHPEAELAPKIVDRRAALDRFLSGLAVADWLRDNGLTDAEVATLAARLHT